jgi:hypothetical protein
MISKSTVFIKNKDDTGRYINVGLPICYWCFKDKKIESFTQCACHKCFLNICLGCIYSQSEDYETEYTEFYSKSKTNVFYCINCIKYANFNTYITIIFFYDFFVVNSFESFFF